MPTVTEKLQKLKLTSYEFMTNRDIRFLEKHWIINGIWPESYWKIARWFMTRLFSMVCYKRHDVNFWQQTGFHNANWGLLKYSFISIANNYKKICTLQWYKKLYLVPIFYITIPFKVWIIALAYSAVESPAWKRAYDLSK